MGSASPATNQASGNESGVAALPEPISIAAGFASTTFLGNRTPLTTSVEHFATLSSYRDGGVYVANYAGTSEWERHPAGDEVVMVIGGTTTITLLLDREAVVHKLGPNELIVVPQNTWHRFETGEAVKVMTITPQPSDHSVKHPSNKTPT